MFQYNRINNLVGWLVFAVATIVYVLTLEPTASFWDSGEFIACSYKLLVPHPPGAPFYLLLGRMFSLFAGEPAQVAWWVNLLSALSSSFTVLFLFWTITILAKRLLISKPVKATIPTAATSAVAEELVPTLGQTIAIMGAGAVGALAFTFSDSFWFSAVEAEVYALSSFFTAFVVWAMLRWESRAHEATSDKWLILIAYMVGLSIGAHLLNLVAIPALAFIFFFRLKKYSTKGAILTMVVSALILGVVLVGVIPGLPSLAGGFEVFFINSIGLPFGAGVIVFVVLFIAALVFAVRYSIRTGNRTLHTALLSFIFVLIGYSSYLIIPIRSGYDPTIDENDPENIVSFVSYLKREQYGDRPLLFGPQFNAEPINQEEGASQYIKGNDKYIEIEPKVEPVYDTNDKVLLPRLYSNQPGHIAQYKKWVDIQEGQKPSFGENMKFLFQYQMGHMFWRYFGWNFIGRDGDIQNSGVLWPWEGNDGLPERVLESKARNNFFLLPFALGVIGLIYQLRKKQRDAFVVGLLFFFTGLAIVIYLNQPPIEPRERDYTFAGAFYAFSIWIGLGVLAVADFLRKTFKSDMLGGVVATVVGLLIPGVMAAQGWDDHDRSDRYHSVDSAHNLLNSVAPNAILFTNGDNDTFPLWYVQEVEGFRTDVRVAVLSYMNTDWYLDQMKRQAYESEPFPMSLENENYRQGINDYLPYVERPEVAGGIDLKQYIQLVKQNHQALQIADRGGRTYMSFPTKNFFLNVDKQAVVAAKAVPQERQDSIVTQMRWTIDKGGLEKKHLAILDLLANNNWQRPVYFSTTADNSDFVGLDEYLQLEGLAYRIVPVRNTNPEAQAYVAKDIMFDNMMNKMSWRNLDREDIFYDENYLRFPANARDKYYQLAVAYLQAGDKETAKKVLNYSLTQMPDNAIPYDYYIPPYVLPLYQVGEQKKAQEIVNVMAKRSDEALNYYFSQSAMFDTEIRINLFIMQQLIQSARQIGMTQKAAEIEQKFMQYYGQMAQ
ncbi:MAG: protein O-mannosyl-transferase family [Rufibacter sp.]